MAAGVASDSAQGQVATSTASVAGKRARRVDEPPGHEYHRRTNQDPPEEPGRGPVGRPRDAWPLCLRTLQQRDDAGQHRAISDRGDPHPERRAQVLRARVHRRAGVLRDRGGFAGQHGLIHASGAFCNHPVRCKHLAGPDQQFIAGFQFGGLDVLHRAIAQAPRGDRRQSGERVRHAAGTMARDHLDVATERQEEHEHGHRVEIHVAVPGECIPHARDEREHDGDADRHVHADAPCPQRLPGANVERPARVERDRHRDQHAHQPQQLADAGIHAGRVRDIERHREHHHLHHSEACHREPLERGAALEDGELAGRVTGQRVRAQPHVLEHSQQVAEAGDFRVPGEPGAGGRRIDAHVAQAALLAQGLVREPAAGRAAQSLEQHRHGPRPARLGGAQSLDQLRVVVSRPAVGSRCLVGTRGSGITVAVVVAESGPCDEFSDGPAAVAADRLVTRVDPRMDHDAGGNWLAAVETGRTGRGHGAR